LITVEVQRNSLLSDNVSYVVSFVPLWFFSFAAAFFLLRSNAAIIAGHGKDGLAIDKVIRSQLDSSLYMAKL
jgi:hypothetical protein